MAVWIYAYGKNGLLADNTSLSKNYVDVLNSIALDETKILDSILECRQPRPTIREYYTNNIHIEHYLKSMTNEEYKKYATSIGHAGVEINSIIECIINDSEKREHERETRFNHAYNNFKSGQVKSYWEEIDKRFFMNTLCKFDGHDGLRVSVFNDLVRISGTFSVFSIYSRFQESISVETRDYYHSYFKTILRAFKSDFILYAHEWSGLDDDANKDFKLADLIEQSDWNSASSASIHSMDRFYYEKL